MWRALQLRGISITIFFMQSNTPTTEKRPKREHPMEYLFKTVTIPAPRVGDLVEGTVIGKEGARLFIDLGPFGSGVVYYSEFVDMRDTVRNLRPGDKVTTKVIALENDEGFVELSLAAAGQEIVWRDAEVLMREKKQLALKVVDANSGGLVLEWKGMQGFLPASQLRVGHYPRVEGGDKDKILDELKKLIGQTLSVTVISANPKEGKLIFSEKGVESEEIKEMISKYTIGDVVEGEVTGIVDFGVFIKIEEGLEGLAHISELDWGLVDDPNTLFHVGDKAKAKIISIKDGKFSLSVKALLPDPWQEVKDKYKKGDIVEGVVIRFNKYGALISVEEGVSGLVHISEFENEKAMKEKIELGKTYPFQITLFEPDERKMTLVYLGEGAKPRDEATDQPKTEDKKQDTKEEEK
ncbi:MAG: 30S ribosomal protein S1 [Candidatus Niyogibacteria bacterium CG10_big_fil_rev_8_21_14_0_10_46_36]|uniref:30S ribosomal protein S1 n=1 Tax=Candidatus Niyogibacteria bacterium CG10_big_fil_rev_8_21_14_0_10_46_36 TaxID=1974726 RepID=A0A2H0TDC7_9BACT|nr:MAG: 30S ribosomal protein S1 [Candidatus Niyogibacteria bacterium CG10_big_fil_rev_8_21_14_0_10_46_36]